MMATSGNPYRLQLDRDTQENERYIWLKKYLEQDTAFLTEHLHPIRQGKLENNSTRVVIADFHQDSSVETTRYANSSIAQLKYRLSTRSTDIHGRLIFVSAVSGVREHVRKEQLQNSSRTSHHTLSEGKDAPILTFPRNAGIPGTHPIKEHISILPDPSVLGLVMENFDMEFDILLRHLDQNAHLSYRTQTRAKLSLGSHSSGPLLHKEIRISVDQANHCTALIKQERTGAPWTILILSSEDNCMGIDFNKNTSTLRQPLRESKMTPSDEFESTLELLEHEQKRVILKNPLSLVALYSSYMASAFAAHIELYQRNWSISYEPYANTSVVYGYAYHRDAVRHLARRYTTHLRYINHTQDNLQRLLALNKDPDSLMYIPALPSLLADFEYFRHEISALKSNCDQFLEQQVSKLALQDARTSIREARDLKRISYMAFIFVPLSLTSSFFGMNVKELDSGSTPLWVFIVTALAILLSSLLIVQVSGAKWVDTVGKGVTSFFSGVKEELFPSKKPGPGSTTTTTTTQSPAPTAAGINTQGIHSAFDSAAQPISTRNSKWRFWRRDVHPAHQQSYLLGGVGYDAAPPPMSGPPPVESQLSAHQYSTAPFPASANAMYTDLDAYQYLPNTEYSLAPVAPSRAREYADPLTLGYPVGVDARAPVYPQYNPNV